MSNFYFILDGVDQSVINEQTTVMLGDNLEYTVSNPRNGIDSPFIISMIILLLSIVIIIITNKKRYFIKI